MAKTAHLMMVGARVAGYNAEDDHYPTPDIAIESLLRVERFEGDIWEPACGEGSISRMLEKWGHRVISTDLRERGYGEGGVDFLSERVARAPNILTNPPYSVGTEFARHAVGLVSGKVALLVRLAFLEGQKRRSLFEESQLARVWIFSARLPRMHKVGWTGNRSTSTTAFAWLVWQMDAVGPPRIGWL